MKVWAEEMISAKVKIPFPILSFPGLELTGDSVLKAVTDGERQADGVVAISKKYKMSGAVTFMDLSVEAEAFGSEVRFSDHEVPTIIDRIIETRDDAENLAIPEIGSGRTAACILAVRRAKEQITDRPVFAGQIGPYSLAGRLMDMTELMINMSEEPEFVHSVLDKVTSFLISYARALKETGCDGIMLAEPAAGLISPLQSEEFAMNYVKRVIEAVQDENFAVILHNCGNTVGMVKHMENTGALGLHFGNAVDMRLILPQVSSHVLVFGNLDPARVLKNGTIEDVRKGVEELLEIGESYPNFILSSGCDVPPGTPFENLDMFFRAGTN